MIVAGRTAQQGEPFGLVQKEVNKMTNDLALLQGLAAIVGQLLDGPQSDQTDSMDQLISAYDVCNEA